MSSYSAGDEPNAVGDFFCSLHRAVLHLAAGAHNTRAFGETELGVDFRPVLSYHELDAELGGAFLAGLGQENDITVQRHLVPFE